MPVEILQDPWAIGAIGVFIGFLFTLSGSTDTSGIERELSSICEQLRGNGAPSLQLEVRLLRMELSKHRETGR